MSLTKTTHLSLGSNIGDKLNNLQDAIFAIHKTAGEVVRISPVYESSAWGFEAENFFNICITIQTKLIPQHLIDTLLNIEQELGRIRFQETGYEPRKIDIDILRRFVGCQLQGLQN